MNEQTLKILCLIVNTGEYCKTKMDEFSASIRKAVGNNFKEKIDVSTVTNEIKAQYFCFYFVFFNTKPDMHIYFFNV